MRSILTAPAVLASASAGVVLALAATVAADRWPLAFAGLAVAWAALTARAVLDARREARA